MNLFSPNYATKNPNLPNGMKDQQQQQATRETSGAAKMIRDEVSQQLLDQQNTCLSPAASIASPTSSYDIMSVASMADSDSPELHKKCTHSAIEKRRRDKMNTYINDLAAIIPTCSSAARKMDKLTILRLTLQHMRSLQGGCSGLPSGMGGSELETCARPSHLTDTELKHLLLSTSSSTHNIMTTANGISSKCSPDFLVDKNCFLFVVDSVRGRMLYVSESVGKVLGHAKSDLFGQSLFDILHPKDVAKVKEQMSSLDPSVGSSVTERLIDAKTMLPVGCPLYRCL